MRPDLDRILKAILDDVLSEIHNILKSEVGINLKVGKNTLAGSDLDKNISGKITSEGLDVEFPHYIVYVEWDRPERYKNPPPYSVILDWIKRKGIQPTAGNIKTVEQLAWVFRYVIWRDGWDKRLIAGLNRDYDYMKSPLDEYIDKMWESKWADMLYDAITKELEHYFKD
jgi:hypothetical protein